MSSPTHVNCPQCRKREITELSACVTILSFVLLHWITSSALIPAAFYIAAVLTLLFNDCSLTACALLPLPPLFIYLIVLYVLLRCVKV